ncbi:MAG: LCP family protein, partial [Eubacteriales bacterium]|nr:LCP family protein [Eubacteriales bacterium]
NGGQQMNYQQGNGGQQMNYRQAPNYNYGGQPPYYQQPYPGGQGNVPNKKKKKRKTRKIVLFVIEVLLLVILAAALYVGAQISKLSQIQNVNTEEQNAIQSNISQQLDDAVEETLKGYWNIALYGIDSREGSTESGLSDTIMICSINRSTKEVKLVSVYRDTYLDNTNGDYRKATECYILGGPSRSINMLNKNFDLDIVNYVTVNMNIVAEVVDSVGGVDIDVRQEEIEWINGYQNETSTITNREIVPVTSAGMQTLNGIQATSYCRIRQIGLDYERTERQRKVLMAILEKVKKNPTLLLSIIDDVLPYVSTNLTKTQILDLATDVASYNLTDTTGFPFEKEAITMDNDIVVPVNLAQNVAELHQYLFGSDGYTPSATVQEISNTIANVTGVY